jgi:hypothetical protein
VKAIFQKLASNISAQRANLESRKVKDLVDANQEYQIAIDISRRDRWVEPGKPVILANNSGGKFAHSLGTPDVDLSQTRAVLRLHDTKRISTKPLNFNVNRRALQMCMCPSHLDLTEKGGS